MPIRPDWSQSLQTLFRPALAAVARWWRRQSPARQDRFATLGPLLSVLLFLGTIVLAFWYLRNEEIERESESVKRDTEIAQQQLRLRLIENQEQMARIAREIVTRAIDSYEFSAQASAFAREAGRRGMFPQIPSLKEHMTMNRGAWDAIADRSNKGMGELYFRSYLLVYFFNHLDEDKKGTRFIKFMDAVYGDVKALREFFADPRVKRYPDGRFSYPSDFPPPDIKPESAPFKHLEILMEGRSYAQLAEQIKTAYKDVGVKLILGE